MTAKSEKDDQKSKVVISVKGGVNAGRDVIMGDQSNYINAANIQTPPQFVDALQRIQTEIVAIKQAQLTPAQTRNLEMVEGQIVDVVVEAQKPQPLLERIKAILADSKETMDMLGGSLSAAATLGVAIGELALLAAKIFGR